jgi:hypothetical protein
VKKHSRVHQLPYLLVDRKDIGEGSLRWWRWAGWEEEKDAEEGKIEEVIGQEEKKDKAKKTKKVFFVEIRLQSKLGSCAIVHLLNACVSSLHVVAE